MKDEKENQILNIKKLKIVCNECKTEIITHLGDSVFTCPVCNTSFDVNRADNYFIKLKDTLERLKNNNQATFSFICEEKESKAVLK